MRISMFTNTYLPMVGGAAVSVARFTAAFREQGHRVLVVAPEYEEQPEDEEDVLRVPALKNFNDSKFSVPFSLGINLDKGLNAFCPELIHAHHPFFLGDSALRAAASRSLPIVVTHHTTYENYVHYVPGTMDWMKEYVVELAVRHANLCSAVVAPSRSIARRLQSCGVETPVHVIPTGIDPDRFREGDGALFRKQHDIPAGAAVVGHVGRLAREKNLAFLARGVSRVLRNRPKVHVLVVGSGPAEDGMRRILQEGDTDGRVHFVGERTGKDLADAYHAMDVFVFASKTETQGLVLIEAMAAGVPVVALSAAGADDVVRNGENGLLLTEERELPFAHAVIGILDAEDQERDSFCREAGKTAERLSSTQCADKMLDLYNELIASGTAPLDVEESPWSQLLGELKMDWKLWANRMKALGHAASREPPP